LQKAIAKNPEEISNYIDLADRYTKNDQLQEAEEVLLKAQEASGGGDLTVREMLEDVQMTLGHRQLEVAQRRAEQEPSDEANNLVKRLKAEVNQRELEVFAARAQRNPSNVTLKYEMGVRLKRAGKFKEAIQALQNARGDVKHTGLVHMELGDCFHYIEQDKLALASYQNAISEISDRDVETKKKALYRAGIMAWRLKEWDVAEGHLSELANLDFSYKDVSKWLDKLGQMRHKQ
jgi:tetratricopeptide (TPR) repeat protein